MSVRINPDKAKAIQRERWRAMREPLLAALDVQFMRAVERADAEAQAAIAVQKQALRDCTGYPIGSDEPDVIKATFPPCLQP